jgi:hypothetical protein
MNAPLVEPGSDLVIEVLRGAAPAAGWTPRHWSLAVQQARAAGLLGRLAHRLGASIDAPHGPWPAEADGHFESALRVSAAQRLEIEREVAYLRAALAGLDAPVVLLKGAAYVMAGLPAAAGRVFSDLDIMVPKEALARAESALTMAGWMSTHHNAYDQRYYRQWMHELPPMQHVQRQTTLDVHHRILPETARRRPDPAAMFACALPVAGAPGMHVLSPPDMVLHAMTHLFFNDDTSHALRDLSDLDLLLRHFGRDSRFWAELRERAERLELQRPLFYGLRYTHRLLATPVPDQMLAASRPLGPGAALLAAMDAIFLRALRSRHPGASRGGQPVALLALYVRGHWLRMPPVMLARHLTIKALGLHRRGEREAGDADPK